MRSTPAAPPAEPPALPSSPPVSNFPVSLAPWGTTVIPSHGPVPPQPGVIARAARVTRAVSTVGAMTAGDILGAALPPPPFLLAPWLPMPGLAMVHAKTGTGKTWLALAISLAAATGGSVLGWRARRVMNVLHIDGETPVAMLRDRIGALLAGMGRDAQRADPGAVPPERIRPETFRFVTGDLLGTNLLDLMTQSGQLAVAPHVAEADLIVIDSIASLFGDVGAGGDWRPAEEWLLWLRRHGKTVLLVHHSARSGAPLGAARKEFVLDATLALRRPVGRSHGSIFSLVFDKLRVPFVPALQPRTVRLVTIDGATRWVGAERREAEAARAAALARAGRTIRDIAWELGVGRSTAHRLVKGAAIPGRAAAPAPGEGGGDLPGTNGLNH